MIERRRRGGPAAEIFIPMLATDDGESTDLIGKTRGKTR
jgi:hypothetical protein